MKMTPALKKWLIDEKGVSAESSNEDFSKAAADALVDGSLTTTKLVELSQEPEADAANAFESQMKTLLETVQATNSRLDALESSKAGSDATDATTVAAESRGKDYSGAKVAETAPRLDKAMGGDGASLDGEDDAGTIRDAIVSKAAQGDIERSGTQVDVISAHKQYDNTRQKAVYPMETSKGQPHPYAGRQVYEDGGQFGKRAVNESSDLGKAVSGAWIKLCMLRDMGNRCPQKMRPTEHDMQLLNYAVREMEWGGVIGGTGSEDEGAIGIKGTKLPQTMWKAVLDELGTSGGLEIAPIVFDDDVIILPLLTGEVFPLVKVVPITRGRRIEGASIGNVTLTSNEGVDGSAITLFDASAPSAFVQAFDTTIFSVAGAIELGLDFLSDTPIDLANIVTQQYGERLLEWLDTQICTGDGTTEPDGVLSATGVTDITEALAIAVGDYEALLFSVAKQYRPLAMRERIAYVSNETVYQTARAIAVGAGDQRRVLGMTHEDYRVLGHPYKINESFTDAQAIFGNFAHYRMYRRLGMTMNWTDDGKELRRSNLLLGTARARFGGQVENGAYFSQATALV